MSVRGPMYGNRQTNDDENDKSFRSIAKNQHTERSVPLKNIGDTLLPVQTS